MFRFFILVFFSFWLALYFYHLRSVYKDVEFNDIGNDRNYYSLGSYDTIAKDLYLVLRWPHRYGMFVSDWRWMCLFTSPFRSFVHRSKRCRMADFNLKFYILPFSTPTNFDSQKLRRISTHFFGPITRLPCFRMEINGSHHRSHFIPKLIVVIRWQISRTKEPM